MASLRARLVAYAPNGGKLGVLPQPTSWDVSVIHNELGALKIKYSRLAAGGTLLERGLEQGLEIAVEVSNGGTWVEPYNCRFLLLARSRNALDRTDSVDLTCQQIAWLGNKILNNDTAHLIQDGDNKGKRAFLSRNPGTIIKTIMDENRARGGAATVLATGFTTGQDSAGVAWGKVYTLYYSLGTPLTSMISSMVGGGAIDWRTEGRVLRMWNADSEYLCRHLRNTVRIQLASHVLEAPEEESIEELSSDILVEGNEGLIFRETNTAAPTPWGKWESYVSQGGVADKATAQAFMQTTLAAAARVRGQYTRSVQVTSASKLPLIDYRPGDWIMAPTVSHGEDVRVQQITMSMSAGNLKVSLTLNDKVYDAQIRQAKKVNGITGGATLAGSEGGRPAPEKDHRTPKAPTGVAVASTAYITEQGTPAAVATITWDPVSVATDNTTIEIKEYRVQYRESFAGAPWCAGGVTEASRPTLGVGALECAKQYEFRVQAIPTYSDKTSAWSTVVTHITASDVTPPAIPAAPRLTSDLGTVTVGSTGLSATGTGFDSDLAGFDVGQADSATGTITMIATIMPNETHMVIGLTMNHTYWFALRSRDTSGNTSDWGPRASIAVAPVVTQDDLNNTATTILETANTNINKVKNDLDNINTKVTEQADKIGANEEEIQANKSAIAAADEKASQAAQAALAAQTTADGIYRIYYGAHDPTTNADNPVKQGDFWFRTQAFWTRRAEDGTSQLANFYTYQADDGTSVLVPLDSEVREVLRYDGTQWNTFDLVATNIIATQSISTKHLKVQSITGELLSFDALYGKVMEGGTFRTTNGNLIANDEGLVLKNPGTGDPMIVMDPNTGTGIFQNISVVNGTVTGGIIQTSSEPNTGLKMSNGGLIGYGTDQTAKFTLTNTGQLKTDGAIFANGEIRASIITAPVIRSSDTIATGGGYMIAGKEISLFDSDGAHTVLLTGTAGVQNFVTGKFMTAPLAKNVDKVVLDPDFRTYSIDDPTVTQTGAAIQFPIHDAAYMYPYIMAESSDTSRGLVSTLALNGGMRTDGSAGAGTGFGAFGRIGQTRDASNKEQGVVYFTASCDYANKSADTNRRKWKAWSHLNTTSGQGTESRMEARGPSKWANLIAKVGDGGNHTMAIMGANDQNGTVGIQADIDTGYLYFGGYLGQGWSRGTFQAVQWKFISGGWGANTVASSVRWSFTPAEYGVYYGIANADKNFGPLIIHVNDTGHAGYMNVVGYNASSQQCDGDVWASVFAWLTKP